MSATSKLLKLSPGYSLPDGFLDERLLRFMCQNDFLSFCMAVKPDFLPTRFHTYLAGKLQAIFEAVSSNRDARDIIACPPQLGKSTITTQLFPAWVLGKKAWPIICSSYSADLAERNSQFCRDIVSSDTYKLIFPRIRLNQDSTSKAYWQTGNGGSYRAVGTLGGLTGFSGKLLLADDLLASQAEADSAVISDGVWSWFKTVFYTRKQSKSGMVLIATRWSLNDPTGRLLEQQEQYEKMKLPAGTYDRWNYMSFPAIAESDEDTGDGWHRKAGQVICPERFTLEDMIKTKNSLVSEGKFQEWASLYQQEPILTENASFKSEWFKFYDENEIKDKDLINFTLVDPAVSQKKSADNSVVTTVSKDRNGPNWYVREETAGHMDPQQLIFTMFDHAARYNSSLNIEAVAFQAALESFVLEEQRRRQASDANFKPFVVNQIKHAYAQKKEERIKGLIPYFKNGTLFIKKSMTDLQKELLQFPKGRHDDRCFVAGTQIATEYGYKNIEDIKIGDRVLTPFGLSPVLDAGCTGIKKVIDIGGLGLIGTEDHPIFINDAGFICVDSQTFDIMKVSQLTLKSLLIWIYQKVLNLMESNTDLWGRESIILASRQHIRDGKILKDFMLRFGNFIREKQFRKAGMFTIKTVIHLIIVLRIWSVLQGSNTMIYLSGLIGKPIRLIWLKFGHWLESGTALKKVRNGIVKILSRCGKTKLGNSLLVSSVVRILNHFFQMLCFAVVGASNPRLDWKSDILLQKNVLSVAENISQIGFIKEKPVQGHVPENCIRKVYNLSVKQGCYYANNILVSNCDCLSFFIGLKILTVFQKEEVKPVDNSYTAMWRRMKGQESEEFNPRRAFNSVT